ncbi:MAG TPA: PfkB family carbohydrate kinase [Vicinamibacteria bacterium]|jgi:sugar/nucleoside kinase (ribokinase family)|nr:PfkB family carbohydrate kinase [Vicinamibacteria bacterium]
MSILVVGSVAYDTVETPFGRAEKVLGGSASFFSVAAAFFAPVNLVAVVGDDFSAAAMAAFQGRPIDLEGLERTAGKTFHWQGKYSYDLNSRETVCTDLNVFEFFKPRIPDRYRRSEHVFLGNIDPVLQRQVLDQVERPRLVACDTMNFWISGKPEEVRRTLAAVDVLLINDAEARQLSGEWNVVKAARAIRALGPHTLVIKKGEHGVLMFSEEGSFAAPAYPLEEVFDPTGAGDTFAGGFLGYLAGTPKVDEAALRRAVVMGSTLASFCVEAFSLDRLLTLSRPEIDARYRLFKRLTHFEEV